MDFKCHNDLILSIIYINNRETGYFVTPGNFILLLFSPQIHISILHFILIYFLKLKA